MKIALLSGAYANAGDSLIEKRAKELLEYVIPNIQIETILRKNIEEKIQLLNEKDAIVFGGGPIYMRDLSGYLPLDLCLEEISTPIMILGGGWYGRGGGYNQTYKYSFSPTTLRFLKKVEHTGLGMSCRDLYSLRTLKKEGVEDLSMTGCPAWFEISHVNQIQLNNPDWNIRNIVISDPAKDSNFAHVFSIVDYLKEKFSNAKITFVFHRLSQTDINDNLPENTRLLVDGLKDRNVLITGIANESDGFSIYDNCDLHIGFRVHAHIYNLSVRNKTILIEEDGRGAGVNQVLGFPALKAYNDAFLIEDGILLKCLRKFHVDKYDHLINDVDSYLQLLMDTDNQYFTNAFLLQREYFARICEFIKRLQ